MNADNSNVAINPKVSVIVAAYGQEQYLGEALDSLLDQTFTDWEAIITDDDSKDNVAKVAQRYAAQDSRFKFLHSENHGLAGVRNLAVKKARGVYVMMLDGDDKIAPRYLEECVKILDNEPAVKMVLADLELFGSQKATSKVEYLGFPALLINNPFYVTAMIRTADFRAIGGFDDRFRTGLEDWEFWIRFLSEEDRTAVRIIHEVMFHYRKKEDSMIANMLARQEIMDGYIHLIFTKHNNLYRKYFGNDIREWMLLKRGFVNEIEYLLKQEYRKNEKNNANILKEVYRSTLRIAADSTLSREQKTDMLGSIVSKWDNRIRKPSVKLSFGKRLRWRLLSKSPDIFIKYAEWKNR